MATSNAVSPGSSDASLDPHAGGTYRDKPIWDLTTIEENLNRTGYDWYTNNYGELDDGVLNFGFWKNIEELNNSYYVNETGSIAFNEAYYSADFSAFNPEQIAAAEKTIGLWNDLVAIDFKETKSGDADITYGNTATGGAQAYAYLPFGSTIDAFYKANYDFDQAGRLGGDVWIDGFVASNFFPIQDSFYAVTTLIHETGHALGLSHPGNYNALDPDGNPVPVTYENQAEYAQDSLQYSIMSYFDGYETGAQFIDFNLLNFAYPSTPMIHDIAAIQAIYGADYTTRADDTTYGFHSTEAGTAYDFTANTRPVLSIWDGGGNDTLNLSGYTTNSYINLNAGAFSSAGGADHFATLDEINANRAALGFAPRTQATYDYYQDLIARLGVTNPQFKDNISIAYGATIENAVGGAGNDTIVANEVANFIKGNGGNDTVSYETSETGVQIALRAGVTGHGGAEGDRFKSIENAIGSRFDDQISGNRGANTFDALQGDDTLRGGAGADTFIFRSAQSSGHDTILDFNADDYIATSKKIPGSNHGGIAHAAGDGTLVLDKSDGDSVVLQGTAAQDDLVYVGKSGNLFYYTSVNNTDASQSSIDKLTHAATLEERDTATQAQIAAADAPDLNSIDLGQRAEGYTGPANSHFGESNAARVGGDSQYSKGISVDPDTGLVANGRAFGHDSAIHADAFQSANLLHVDLALVALV